MRQPAVADGGSYEVVLCLEGFNPLREAAFHSKDSGARDYNLQAVWIKTIVSRPTLSIRLRVTGISGLERHAAFLQLFAASLQLRRVTSASCGSILVRCAFAAYTD